MLRDTNLIEFVDTDFAYDAGDTILRGVSLDVVTGAFHLLLGGPGSGKSTLLALCHGGLAPSRGAVLQFGAEHLGAARRAELRLRIGVVETRSRFLDHLDLRDNIALPLLAGGIDPEGRAADIAALLDWTGLGDRGSSRPAALTAGERQRAAVGRAVILDPALILADDPGLGLDRDETAALMGLFLDLGRMGRTVLLATRDAALADWLAGQIDVRGYRLANGRLEAA
jgi:cell division transport system ATP-binding protein